jgi:uncharacterized membrane protein
MEGLILGFLALVLGVGFVGGLLGARARRGRDGAASVAAELERLRAEIESLHRSQQDLLARISGMETERAGRPGSADAAMQKTSAPAAERSPAVTASPALTVAQSVDAAPEMQAPAAAPERAEAQATVRPPIAQTPAEPGWLARFLFGGNTVVRVGIVVLFFGVAFLLRYTYERVQVPIELRLTGVVLAAIVLLGLGWRLRAQRPGYALALQGGGVGLLYLTVFAALRLYALLPAAGALALLTGLAVFSAMLAVLQNSMALAVLGASGGFLAPILASTGAGSHVLLFSYYALLDVGILAIAWFRAWRPLNLLGFAFTFVIGGVWGARYYRPELFGSTQPFLALFFLIFVAIPVLFARRAAPDLRAYVDGTLVFGTPLVAFGLQLGLVRDIEYGAAYSALALGAFYLVLAWRLHGRSGARLRLLVESFIALGVAFVTLAIPLAFEGRWTAAVWALEGAAILWIGVRQRRLLARVFAVLLQVGAGVAFLLDLPGREAALPVLNSACLGSVLVAVAGLFSARYLERHRERVRDAEQLVAGVLFAWGALWWAGAGLLEIDRYVARGYRHHAALGYLTLSWVALSLLARAGAWRQAALVGLGFTPLALAAALGGLFGTVGHPTARLGIAVWPAALAAHFWLLRRHEDEWPAAAPWLHGMGLWLLALLGAWELAWWIDRGVAGARTWPLIAWALMPAALLAALAARGERWGGPVAREPRGYLLIGCAPLAAYLLAWALLATITSDGNPAPLPYVPLLNPLDLALAAAVVLGAYWLIQVRRRGLLVPSEGRERGLYAVLGGALFVIANGMLLRALRHLAGVPFDFDAMLRSVTVQTAFSVFWTVIALVTMVIATRRGWRGLWLAGGGLMAVVVAKLFVVDLGNVGGVERIVSFIGVGALMLVIGYFSPVPPKSPRQTS